MDYNEHNDFPSLGETGECPNCGEYHEIKYNFKEVNGELKPNHSVYYIECNKNGNKYIINRR
jgi:hypothetical protein